MPAKAAGLDGEMVIEVNGNPSFPAPQDALAGGNSNAYVLYAFDLLHLDGRDLQQQPLVDRKTALARLTPAPGVL